MKGLRAIPTLDEFLECVNALDELSMIVRSHQCVEVLLDNLINEMMPRRHDELVRRLQFSLKLDLAFALGVVDDQARIVVLAINRLRNKFAHELTACISEQEATELLKCIPLDLYEAFHLDMNAPPSNAESFRKVASTAYAKLHTTLNNIKNQKLWDQAREEYVEHLVGGFKKSTTDDGQPEEIWKQRIRERYNRLKEAAKETKKEGD